MAFNPFHSFRKYNKWVFAGLVLMAMFTFVLSSGMGKGDIFQSVSPRRSAVAAARPL